VFFFTDPRVATSWTGSSILIQGSSGAEECHILFEQILKTDFWSKLVKTFRQTSGRALCLWGLVGLSVFVLGYDHCNGLIQSVGLRVSSSSADAVAWSFIRAACPEIADGERHVVLQTNENVLELLLRVERGGVDSPLMKALRSLSCFWRVESQSRSGTVPWTVDVGPDGAVCGFRISPTVLKELGKQHQQSTDNERAIEYLHRALERATLNRILVVEQFDATSATRFALPFADTRCVARSIHWGARFTNDGSLCATLELDPPPSAKAGESTERSFKAIALKLVVLWGGFGIWLSLAFAIAAGLARWSGWISVAFGVMVVVMVMFLEQELVGADGCMQIMTDVQNLPRVAWRYSKLYLRLCVCAAGGGFMALLAFARPMMLDCAGESMAQERSSVATGFWLGLATLGLATAMEWARLRMGGNIAAGSWFYCALMNSCIPWGWPAIWSVVPAFIEELQYRVLPLSLIVLLSKALGLRRRVGYLIAILVSSSLFACAHVDIAISPIGWSMLRVFVPGLMFGWAFVKTDFVTVFTAHWTFNATLGCVQLLRTPATILEGVGATLACGVLLMVSHAIVGCWQGRKAMTLTHRTYP
jgi:hypothetical protein